MITQLAAFSLAQATVLDRPEDLRPGAENCALRFDITADHRRERWVFFLLEPVRPFELRLFTIQAFAA